MLQALIRVLRQLDIDYYHLTIKGANAKDPPWTDELLFTCDRRESPGSMESEGRHALASSQHTGAEVVETANPHNSQVCVQCVDQCQLTWLSLQW